MPLKDTVKAIVVSMSMLSFLVFPTGCAAQNQSQGTGSPPVQAPANQNSVKQPDRDTNETTSKKNLYKHLVRSFLTLNKRMPQRFHIAPRTIRNA